MKFSLKQHSIFWVGYLIWEVSQGVGSYLMGDSPFEMGVIIMFTKSALVTTVIKIALAYLLLFAVLKPAVIGKRKSFFIIALSFLSILLALFLYRTAAFYYILPYLYELDMSKRSFINISALVTILLDIVTPVFALIIYELFRFTRKTRDNAIKMEQEKLKSELSFLKAQINPHFLFNVLSTIHALTRNESPHAANVTVKLSNIMRFMLYEATNKEISIQDEVKILEDYIDLERTRFKHKLDVEFVKEIADNSQKIAPLILLPFLENAFKHGAGESRFNSFIKMNLQVKENLLLFTVVNSLETIPANHENFGGIGLTNVKRRLDLLYPSYELNLQPSDFNFSVTLKIKLSENDNSVLFGN